MSNRNLGDHRFVFSETDILPGGKGGQGKVYQARDLLQGGGIVAVKILHNEDTADMTFLRQLLLEEAKLQASVSSVFRPHPHIVYIIHIGMFKKDLGIVMEYVDGGSLRQRLGPRDETITLPVEQVLEIALQVCDALAVAHERNVIHRDIKPANILINRGGGTIKLADWGVAKNIDIAGRGKTYIGTPPYMSPEVVDLNRKSREERLRSEGVDGRTDIYSLGVTMYEMLTGDLPFDGENQILTGVKPRHQEALRKKGVDATLAALVLKSMARYPKDRYQTVEKLMDELKAYRDRVRRMNGQSQNHESQQFADLTDPLAETWKLYQDKQDPMAAENRFQDLLAQFPGHPQVCLEMGRFYIQRSKENQAQDILSRGLKVTPDYAPLWKTRGILLASKNPVAAIADLEKAVALGLPEKERDHVSKVLGRLKKHNRGQN
jgi:eukaryotic-like serine/threonine-protein kinase